MEFFRADTSGSESGNLLAGTDSRSVRRLQDPHRVQRHLASLCNRVRRLGTARWVHGRNGGPVAPSRMGWASTPPGGSRNRFSRGTALRTPIATADSAEPGNVRLFSFWKPDDLGCCTGSPRSQPDTIPVALMGFHGNPDRSSTHRRPREMDSAGHRRPSSGTAEGVPERAWGNLTRLPGAYSIILTYYFRVV